jgi:hypothetical protein
MEVTYNGARAKYLWHLILNSLSLMVLNTIAGLLGIGMDQVMMSNSVLQRNIDVS